MTGAFYVPLDRSVLYMKRVFSVFVAVLSLTACQFINEEEEATPRSSSQSVVTHNLVPSKSVSFEVSAKSNVFVVQADAANVTLSGNLAGKTIYYATVNSGSKAIPNEYVRYVAENSARSASAGKVKVFESDTKNEQNHAVHHHDDFNPVFDEDSSRAVAGVTFDTEKIDNQVGVTSKNFYVAAAKGSFQHKPATLYASDSICNVWILNDDTGIPENERMEVARIYAEKFSSIYQKIRTVFGEESDLIYVSTNGALAPMENACATGKKVNIIVYDLYGDQNDGETIGLYSSVDYFKNGLAFRNTTITRSNEGKYFYIDSYFAKNCLEYTLSTLAHEFQHMINYSMKVMKGLDCDTNLNEMLSMLCEDMIQSELNISDSYSPKNRMFKFLSNYYDAGIREYNDTLQSYANAYAFGAWLVRNFGGNALIREMMHNRKSNNDCIVSAVNTINGTNYSFESLFALFVKACFDYEDTPRVFENNMVGNLAASYGMYLKTYAVADGNSVKLDFTSISGQTNSGLITYIYVK